MNSISSKLPLTVGDLIDQNDPELNKLIGSLSEIDRSAICVNVIGSSNISGKDTESFCEAIAKKIANLNILFLTGSLKGVQKTITSHLVSAQFDPKRIHHLYPGGKDGENGNVWKDRPEYGCWHEVGDCLEKRRKISAEKTSSLFILVEGGAGSCEEASWVLRDGGIVLPIAATGGAAGGMNFNGMKVDRVKTEEAMRQILSEEDCQILFDKNADKNTIGSIIAKAICNFKTKHCL